MEIERRLSDVLSEFARTLVTDFPIQAILDHLVVRIVDVLPVSAAGVTLIAGGGAPYISASDEAAMRFERLQTELGEGPCLVAYRTRRGRPRSRPPLRRPLPRPSRPVRSKRGWRRCSPSRCAKTTTSSVRSTSTAQRRAHDAGAMTAAQTLADVAAAYLLNAQARDDLRTPPSVLGERAA